MAKARINNKIQKLWNEIKCDKTWVGGFQECQKVKEDFFGNDIKAGIEKKLYAIKILREVKYNR